MKVDIDKLADNVNLIKLSGRLDAGGSTVTRESLKTLAAQERPHLILDLSEVSFIDSSGLGALVSVLKAARQQGGDLVMCGAQQQAKMLFKLTMLDQILTQYDTIDEAKTHWSK
jgi:anti-sigma B factor antagonist